MIAALCATTSLVAQTVYKSVDEKGNVSYSESPPPKGKDGKTRSTTELPIDPNRNVLPAQPPLNLPPRDAGGGAAASTGAMSREEAAADAKAALEAAEAQLEAGSAVQPGDFRGRAGGGVSPSQQRLQRLEELQREVDRARENLERIENP